MSTQMAIILLNSYLPDGCDEESGETASGNGDEEEWIDPVDYWNCHPNGELREIVLK